MSNATAAPAPPVSMPPAGGTPGNSFLNQLEDFIYTPAGAGAVAGAAVVVTSIVWLLGCLAYCCYIRRKKKDDEGSEDGGGDAVAEHGGGRGGGRGSGRGGGRGGGRGLPRGHDYSDPDMAPPPSARGYELGQRSSQYSHASHASRRSGASRRTLPPEDIEEIEAALEEGLDPNELGMDPMY